MKQKKAKKIALKTVWFAVISSIVLGLASLCVGLAVFRKSVEEEAISRACTTTIRTAKAAEHAANTAGLARDVMEVYESLTPEQRSMTGTEEYRQFFEPIESVSKTGGAYDTLANLLRNYAMDVTRIAICTYDAENSAQIFLADSLRENPMYPGEWLTVPDGLMNTLLEFTDYDWNGNNTPYETWEDENEGLMFIAGYPVRDENNEKCAYVLTAHHVSELNTKLFQFASKVVSVVLFLTLLIAFFVGMRMKKAVADPVNTIANTAMAYVRDRKNGVARSDHFSSLNIKTGDELENLTHIMADMEKDLSEHEEHIKKIIAEKERFSTELDMARQIQASALPNVFPPFPDRTEFDLYASMTPAKTVGGDFYDFFLIDDDHLALVIADVSDKGIPAALFMMVAKALIKNQLMSGADPASAMDRVNYQLCDQNKTRMFVTVWLAVLEISTGKGLACNAGHENPCIRRSGDLFEILKYKHNLFAGASRKAKYQNRDFEVQPGDCIFVYTDGVPEANNPANEMFGEEKLLETLNQNPDASPEEIVNHMKTAMDRFVDNAPQFDDITMLCMKYYGK